MSELDYVYRCYGCRKMVFEYNIVYDPHRCKHCGDHRLQPMLQDLTKLGKWYCKKRNKIGMWYHGKFKSK